MFSLFRRPQADHHSTEQLLREAAGISASDKDAAVRVWQRVSKKIDAPMFEEVRQSLTPSVSLQASIWNRIRSSVSEVPSSVWSDVQNELSPSQSVFDLVWQKLVMRLSPAPVHVRRLPLVLRWSASALLLVLAFQLAPVIFLQQGAASSVVLLTPKESTKGEQGEVEILIGGLWQPVHAPVELKESALIQTSGAAEATITLHSKAVLRMGGDTTIAIHDVSDGSSSVAYDPTLTFYRGKLWVQSFLTDDVPALSVGTNEGKVQMHEGSVSLVEKDEQAPLDLRVWSREAVIGRPDEAAVTMFAGDQVALQTGVPASVHKFSDPSSDLWMRQNLQLDAIHQQEIAALQRAYMVQKAGTLPTSSLYPIKRLAEDVDVLLSFSDASRAQKQLDHASTRLSEAAALVAQGDSSAAAAPLEEYKQTVLSVASGTGDTIVHALVQQQIAKANADLSAVLPDDTLYALKETVVDTSTAVTDSVSPSDSTTDAPAPVDQGRLLLDKLTALQASVASPGYDVTATRTVYNDLQKEFQSLLSEQGALSASEQTDIPAGLHAIDLSLSEEEAKLAPAQEPALILNSEQVRAYVDRIINRILVYRDPHPQVNQLRLELDALKGNVNQAAILRQLRRSLTSDELRHFVDLAMDQLRSSIPQ